MYTSNEILKKKLAEKEILIASHRGSCGGNVCQNNRLSYITALLFGADMIEMDVIKSTDGVFYAYHNGTEKVNLDIDKDIRTMSSEEIDAQQYYNWLHYTSGVKVATMEDILDEFEEKCLINIDRAWHSDWKGTIEAIKNRPNRQSILLKSPPEHELLQILEESGADIMYMPIIKTVEDWNRCKEYYINVAAVEVIFNSLDHPLVQPELFAEWKELGIVTWVNTITISNEERHNIAAWIDDNMAIAEGFDKSWGRLIDMGFQILQTDWPGLLSKYLEERKVK